MNPFPSHSRFPQTSFFSKQGELPTPGEVKEIQKQTSRHSREDLAHRIHRIALEAGDLSDQVHGSAQGRLLSIESDLLDIRDDLLVS